MKYVLSNDEVCDAIRDYILKKHPQEGPCRTNVTFVIKSFGGFKETVVEIKPWRPTVPKSPPHDE